jgi:hypothetical protein
MALAWQNLLRRSCRISNSPDREEAEGTIRCRNVFIPVEQNVSFATTWDCSRNLTRLLLRSYNSMDQTGCAGAISARNRYVPPLVTLK